MFITFDIIGITLFFIYAYFICSKINSNTFLENYGRFHLTLMFCCIRDGLHLTTEGNAVVYEELIKVFDEAGLSAVNMPMDFPHHSKIDSKHPERAFQQHV